ncbi:hypothetical protein DPMN_054765 [Dreissena polymorpha]|uniref:Uncharacterized protein n=1 Tax=Dreissena polymorpha TaxID=45954 RepID=A0A9D4HTD8_DREPO|nr:hypothetical protein DPMN_054765 [Dreissena polymorpha]
MLQKRGSCGHVKAEWDSHGSCLSCTGCTQIIKCSFCEVWLDKTWRIASNRRKYQSRKRGGESFSRGSLTSGWSGGSSACRAICPPFLDHDASAIVRSLPGNVTGHHMTGPFTGYPAPVRPVRIPVMTRRYWTRSPYSSSSRRRSTRKRSHQRSRRRFSRRPRSQHCRTVSRHRREKGHRHASRRRSRTYGSPDYSLTEYHGSFHRVAVPILTSTHVYIASTTTGPSLSTNISTFNSQAPGSGVLPRHYGYNFSSTSSTGIFYVV